MRPPTRAFSLVEVTLALGLVSFCLVGLLGLLTTGFIGVRSSHEQNNAAFLLEKIATDVKAGLEVGGPNSPIYNVPLSNTTGQLQPLAAPLEYAGSRFAVSHRIERKSASGDSFRILLRAAWPAEAPAGSADFTEVVSAWNAP
jgi:type II secretory pathway pseudopilin PulG